MRAQSVLLFKTSIMSSDIQSADTPGRGVTEIKMCGEKRAASARPLFKIPHSQSPN
jgi:hypothetical protein